MLVVEDNLSTASDETVLLEDFERDRVDTSPACAAFADAAGVSVPDPSSDVVILSSGLCQICIIHKVNCVLQCGHALCSACLFTLLKTRKFVDDSERAMRALCSFCRTEISFFVMKDEPPEKLCFCCNSCGKNVSVRIAQCGHGLCKSCYFRVSNVLNVEGDYCISRVVYGGPRKERMNLPDYKCSICNVAYCFYLENLWLSTFTVVLLRIWFGKSICHFIKDAYVFCCSLILTIKM
jgi:hypothetical protein